MMTPKPITQLRWPFISS